MPPETKRESLRSRLVQRAKQVLPPALVALGRDLEGRFYNGGRPEWEYLPHYPSDRPAAAAAWNVPAVAQTQRLKWDSFRDAVEGPGPLGIAHEAPLPIRQNLAAHNSVISFGYVLALAAWGSDQVSVLDWGGGAGHYYLLARSLLPEVEVDYHCKEVPVLCATGRELLPDVTFHETDGSAFTRSYTLVMASGALQFAVDWQAQLQQLAGAAAKYLYVTRLPVVRHADSYGLLQRAHRYGYATEYTNWVLNRGDFLAAAEGSGMQLVREFLVEEGRPRIRGVPESAEHGGFLFRRSATSE
jgi:putative methyltransferase (TIGR04325 family)